MVVQLTVLELELVDMLPWWCYTKEEKDEYQYEPRFDSYNQLGGYYRWVNRTMKLTEDELDTLYLVMEEMKGKGKDEIVQRILHATGIPVYNSKFNDIQGIVAKRLKL
jgi:hypothetical protein